MSTHTDPATTATIESQRWNEPDGLNPRGTLVVLAGEGEGPEIYGRLGRRLAADAYRVVALSVPDPNDPAVPDRIADVFGDGAPAPHVLVGSDTGAALTLRLATDPEFAVDAVITAGLRTASADLPEDWEAQIEARTACPTHRGVLHESPRRPAVPGLVALPPTAADHPHLPAGRPILAIHGTADTISPLDDARAAYRAAGIVEITTVTDGRHDILNDLSHRSVAATIVLFLERLRAGVPAVITTTHIA